MILLAVFGVTVIIIWYLNESIKRKKCPPGPFVFPVVGNTFQVAWSSDLPHIAFDKLSRCYGNIMTLKMGKQETNYETIQELCSRNDFSDRSLEMEYTRERNMHKNIGIIFSSGKSWNEIRKFSLKNLREFGFGKALSMEQLIETEIEAFMDHVQKKMQKANNIVEVDGLFSMPILNIIWCFATGVRFDHSDAKLNELVHVSDRLLMSTSFAPSLVSAFPILRKLFPELSGKNFQTKALQDMHNYFREVIEEYKNRESRKIKPENFVETFINQIEAESNNPDSLFTEDQLVMILLDLFQAGGETSVQVLSFSIMYLVLYPEVQEKVQQEIDKVIPEGTFPNLSQKQSMVYTLATIFEICRHGIVVPIPPARIVPEDLYFKNFLFRKGVEVNYNIYSVCSNKTSWGDPENFRPERFIMDDGNLNVKLFDRMCIFGLGKRNCIGGALAMNTIFLFLSSLLQRMTFKHVPGKPVLLQNPRNGITMSPQPFSVLIEKRQ